MRNAEVQIKCRMQRHKKAEVNYPNVACLQHAPVEYGKCCSLPSIWNLYEAYVKFMRNLCETCMECICNCSGARCNVRLGVQNLEMEA